MKNPCDEQKNQKRIAVRPSFAMEALYKIQALQEGSRPVRVFSLKLRAGWKTKQTALTGGLRLFPIFLDMFKYALYVQPYLGLMTPIDKLR